MQLLDRTQCPKLASLQVMKRACEYSISLHEGGHEHDPGTPAAFYAGQYRTWRRSAAYRAIVATAESRNLPQHYATDMTNIDRVSIERMGPGARFLWGVRRCGTFLIHLFDDAQAPMTRQSAKYGIDYLQSCLSLNPDTSWFFWDSTCLTSITASEARELAQSELGLVLSKSQVA